LTTNMEVISPLEWTQNGQCIFLKYFDETSNGDNKHQINNKFEPFISTRFFLTC
jgi:hypothetical protein